MSAPAIPQPAPEKRSIYYRMMQATTEAKGPRPANRDGLIGCVFVGDVEWNELCALCEAWGVEWSGKSSTAYDPRAAEANRAEFAGFKIYRVDAVSLLAATFRHSPEIVITNPLHPHG